MWDILVNAAGNVFGTAVLGAFAWLRVAAGRLWRRRGRLLEHTSRLDVSLPAGGKTAASAEREAAKLGEADYRRMSESTVFFARRFAEAFPDCRGLCEFDNPRNALHRLDILLREPLTATARKPGMGKVTAQPMWWFRGGSNLQIEQYRHRRVLFVKTGEFYFDDVDLHKLRRMVAINHTSYFLIDRITHPK